MLVKNRNTSRSHKKESQLTSVPDLRLDDLPINIDTPSREFHSDGRFRFEVEFISGESREHCGGGKVSIMASPGGMYRRKCWERIVLCTVVKELTRKLTISEDRQLVLPASRAERAA